MQSQRHAMLATKRIFLFWTVFIFFKITFLLLFEMNMISWHQIQFVEKKNNFHSELSTQMNWPIIMERARCTFILLISQLINWFGMQWVDLVWHWCWYSTGMVFNLTSTHGCIQSNQFHFIITTSRCSAYETKVSIIKWAIII